MAISLKALRPWTNPPSQVISAGHTGIRGDRSAVTGGTRVLSDHIKVKITSQPGRDFSGSNDRPGRGCGTAKNAKRDRAQHSSRRTHRYLSLAVVTLQPFAIYSGSPQTIFVLVSLLVCLIPTTIGGLLSAIGIAGIGPVGATQRAGHVRACRGGSRRCRHLAAGQNRNHYIGNRQATEFVAAPV